MLVALVLAGLVTAVHGGESLIGFRLEIGGGGPREIREGESTVIELFGTEFTSDTQIALTFEEQPSEDGSCWPEIRPHNQTVKSVNILEVALAVFGSNSRQYCYICLKDSASGLWRHQGDEFRLSITVSELPVSPWLLTFTAIVLLATSGLFSGLTLGLLNLNMSELQVIKSCGLPDEQDNASKIIPLRRRGNYLLCSLVLGNVFVNNVFTIYVEDQLPEGIGLALATLGIVVFGEILPQALCSRYGLAIGAKTSLITRFIMTVTLPLSLPISMALDRILGKEVPSAFDRVKLAEYLRIVRTEDIQQEEMNIIFGALDLNRKTAQGIMTRIEDVFMLPYDAILNFETIAEVVRRGYTRVPIFEGSRQNIVGILHTKDLALVSPSDALPLKVLSSFYRHPVCFTFADDPIGLMLAEFKKGKSHLAIVRQVVQLPDRDPMHRILGIITLEDVIEEIIQAEINDETDTLTDNRRLLRRVSTQIVEDLDDFLRLQKSAPTMVSPQMAFAAFQYLVTAVPDFSEDILKPSLLRKLMPSEGLYHEASFGQVLTRKGESQDFFLLILEGRVQITMGQDSLQFESGPFSYFGIRALRELDDPQPVHMVPDYSLVVASEKIIYMKISRDLYKKVVRLSRDLR